MTVAGALVAPDTETAMGRYLITSALPYINGIKHLGNLAGSMLPADVHARFRRMQGHEVLFICATDEHGTPAELGALEAGLDVRSYCDQQHALQRDVCGRFGLSFDWFGRSSSRQNRELTQHFAERLEEAGLIEERTTPQVYSVEDRRFLPDRYVEGTCPRCGYENARGDQCDNCGALLDPVDLIRPRSKISGSERLEVRDTTHLFLLQDRMAGRIRAWVDAAQEWPPLARSIAYKWLDEGLQPRAITRDLDWGVPVTKNGRPRPGFDDKVFYVWFDAPIEYIAATAEWADATGGEWRRWWLLPDGADEVTYVQFMGKDNVAFHTVSFPVTLLGSGEPWKLVDRLKALNWVTWYGGKFSTSGRRGVFMDQALDLLPADYWRWRLMANAPENADSAFTWSDFQNGVNADLVNVLGNFVNRVIRFGEARFGSVVPDGGTPGPLERSLSEELDTRLRELTEHHAGHLGDREPISATCGTLVGDQRRCAGRRLQLAHRAQPCLPRRPDIGTLSAAHCANDPRCVRGGGPSAPLAGEAGCRAARRIAAGQAGGAPAAAVPPDRGRRDRRLVRAVWRRGVIRGRQETRVFIRSAS